MQVVPLAHVPFGFVTVLALALALRLVVDYMGH
jgi:hypothetical protein